MSPMSLAMQVMAILCCVCLRFALLLGAMQASDTIF